MPSRTGIPLDVAPGPLREEVNRRRSVTVYSTIPSCLLFPAGRRAAVDRRRAFGPDEAPVVAVGPQVHRQHAHRVVPADLAAAFDPAEGSQAVAAGADDDLNRSAPDPAVGVVGEEPLVVVLVSVEDQVDATLGELRPQRLQRGVAAVLDPRGETRPVEGDQSAVRRVAELLSQPLALQALGIAAADLRALRVE